MLPFRLLFACFTILFFIPASGASKPPSIPVLFVQQKWKHSFPETQFLDLRARSSRYFVFYRRSKTLPQSPSSPPKAEEMVVLDRKSGNILWQKPMPEFSATADEQHLYLTQLHQSSVTLRCLDWANGDEVWHTDLPYAPYFRLWTLTNKPEAVFYWKEVTGEQNASIFCLDSASGQISWQAQGMRYYLGATREHLYFSGFGRDRYMVLYRFPLETGKALPSDPVPLHDLGSWSPETGVMLYVPQSQRYVFEYSVADTGLDFSSFFVTDADFKTLWRQNSPQGQHSGPGKAFVEGDIVAYSMSNANGINTSIEARHLSTGRPLWQKPIKAAPIWETNRLAGMWRGVWLYQHKNQLFGLGLHDGKVKWSLPLPTRAWNVTVEDQQALVVQKDEKHDSWNILVY